MKKYICALLLGSTTIGFAGTYSFTGATWTTDSSQQSGLSSWQSATGSGNPPGISGNNWKWHKTEASSQTGWWSNGWYYGVSDETKRYWMTFLFTPSGNEAPGTSLIMKAKYSWFNFAWAHLGSDPDEDFPGQRVEAFANCSGLSLSPSPAHAVDTIRDEFFPEDQNGSPNNYTFFPASPDPTIWNASDILLDISWTKQENGTYTGLTSYASWHNHTLTLYRLGVPPDNTGARSGAWHWFRPDTIGGEPVN